MGNGSTARRPGSQIVCVLATTTLAVVAVYASPPDLPAGVSSDWWTGVQRSIQLEEYGVVAGDGAEATYRAANPAHRFEARFGPHGVRLAPSEDSAWEWGLALRAWGRDGTPASASAGSLESQEDRVELDRGGLTEWFVNTPAGLEHGFTVPARPSGAGGALIFDLVLVGSLRPVFADEGQAIDFYSTSNVAVLRYAKLRVTDALDHEVPARFEPIPGGIRMAIDDAQAIYPLSVDPLATTYAWSVNEVVPESYLGECVATAGDVNGDGYSDVLVGARGFNGSAGKAYLYLGRPSGLSTVAAWSAVGEAGWDEFGKSLGAAGDVDGDGFSDVVVGAQGNDGGRGKAYVYLGGPAGLASTADWTAVGNHPSGSFGWAVASAGDVNGDGYSDLVVGAPHSGYTPALAGAAYLFLGGAGGLEVVPSWSFLGGWAGGYLGDSVASAGDVNRDGYSDVVVGAWGFNSLTGRAYLFRGGPGGLTTASWWVDGPSANSYFSRALASAGDVNGDGYADVVIGSSGPAVPAGRVDVYYGAAAGLATSPSWTRTGSSSGDHFGHSAASAGDVNGDGYADVVIGAPFSRSGIGTSYVYLGSASGLSANPVWSVDGGATVEFGCSVATAGDVNGDGHTDVIVGACAQGAYAGRAELYLGGGDGPVSAASWTGSGEATGSTFGRVLASAGDVDADGYDDVVVGAYSYSSYTGRAYLYRGGAGGPSTTPSWTLTGGATGDRIGCAVGSAGDVNADGFSDVIIGAFGAGGFAGQAHVFHGGAVGLPASPSWSATGEAANDYFGYTAAGAGDVDGDGYSDVIVGAIGVSGSAGRAYLFRGSAAGLSSSASWFANGQAANDRFGFAVASAGDVQGDGRADVLVGADQSGGQGIAYLYAGAPAGLGAPPAWSAVGEAGGHAFGSAVAGAGDVNGDGYSDVAIGAKSASSSKGKAYVYFGGPSGLPAVATWTAEGEAISNAFGSSVASAGDVNADGYADLLIGAPSYNSGTGRAYLYLGSAAGLASGPSWITSGEASNNNFGYAVASAGDVDGDGHTDALVGALGYSGNTGRAYLYFGGGHGAVVRPNQLRYDGSARIPVGGIAHEQRFRLGLTLRSPVGRVLRTLQWQVAPWGGVFTPTVNPIRTDADWYDTPIARSVPVGLSEDRRRYTWRARVLYHPAGAPVVPWSPWFTMTGNGVREADVRSTVDALPAPCVAPDEEVYIVTVTLDVNDKPVLHFQDPNQPAEVTGYHVYRSASASGPWTRIASNVIDMDEGTPNKQYVDQNGGGGATWYYEVSPFNGACGVEGPR